jgi:hypothetical protein
MEWAKVRRRAAKTEAQTAPLGHTQPCTPTMPEFRYQQRRHLTRSGTQHDPDSGRRGRGAALPAKPAHQRFVRLAERRVRCGGRGARFQTCDRLLYLAVQRLEVFGLDPVDPVRPESRDKVHLDGRTVSGQRLVPDRHRRDVLYSVGEPLLDRPSAARFAHFSGAPLLFEFLDCLAHFSFGFMFDVAPVGPTVIQHADGDPPMLPAVVLAVVDSGCATLGARVPWSRLRATGRVSFQAAFCSAASRSV